ncbi:MAG: helix-turn-helix domain-containing protein [Actinomycetaceae bacterium]|nr:helix-turn-helix domain-containing protein [Actinomycetaceae bacterium]
MSDESKVFVSVHLPSPLRLGSALRDARVAKGWTQAQVAQAAGVSRQWIVSLESGAPRAEISRVMAVVKVLELSLTLSAAPAPAPVSFQDLNLP